MSWVRQGISWAYMRSQIPWFMQGIFISTMEVVFMSREEFHEYVRELNQEYIHGYHDSHQGMDIMSTYGMLGTLRGYHEHNHGYHEYIKLFSTWKDIVSTVQDFQYIGRISQFMWGIQSFMWGDTMNYLGGYHDSGVGLSSVDQGMLSVSKVSIHKINVFCQWSPYWAEQLPIPNVLVISL